MDFNTFVNSVSWKKIIVVGLAVVIGFWILREIIFWSFFHEAEHVFSKLNTQISDTQKDIQKTIVDSDQEFKDRATQFDKVSNNFDKSFEKAQKEMMGYLDKVDKEREARDKSFDQSFKAAPAKMWAEHEKFGERMQDDFVKKSNEMSSIYNKHVMNVDKTIERARCQMALHKDFADVPPSDLTPQQLRDRTATLKRFAKETAKKEHCEAYL